MVLVGLTSRLIGGVDVLHGYRDWSDGLSNVVRRSAVEAAVGQYTHAEKTSRTAAFRTDWSRCSWTSGAPAITELQEPS